MTYRLITVKPVKGSEFQICEYLSDVRPLPDMTDESGQSYRRQLIDSGQLKPYVEDVSDRGFDRPTLPSEQVQQLRNKLIRSGNIVASTYSRDFVDEVDGRRYHYEADLDVWDAPILTLVPQEAE